MRRIKDANLHYPMISSAFVLCRDHSAFLLDERRCLHSQFRADVYETVVLTCKPFYNLPLEAGVRNTIASEYSALTTPRTYHWG
jgi:hypothetical protein